MSVPFCPHAHPSPQSCLAASLYIPTLHFPQTQLSLHLNPGLQPRLCYCNELCYATVTAAPSATSVSILHRAVMWICLFLSLKLECDKLASEKSEMQRHYVMYYEMSYGLNIEMHKQAEIVKRLNGICAQVLPYLSQEHQQQVLGAIERAKQVTAPELNSIIRQLQVHQLSQLQALALPLTPLPVGLQAPSLPVSASSGLLSLSALGSQGHLPKEDKNGHDGDPRPDDDGDKSD
ncbi:TLE family member 5 isoform X2 [Rhinoderma darwinii]|uniref:TLE family member 5 isoform X2 n=1 Tax=Rhinoderma darwinii TaxID=43563 RepID=UPI003F672613